MKKTLKKRSERKAKMPVALFQHLAACRLLVNKIYGEQNLEAIITTDTIKLKLVPFVASSK